MVEESQEGEPQKEKLVDSPKFVKEREKKDEIWLLILPLFQTLSPVLRHPEDATLTPTFPSVPRWSRGADVQRALRAGAKHSESHLCPCNSLAVILGI